MTVALFTTAIGIFLFGGIWEIYIDTKTAIAKETISWNTLYKHRAFSTVISTAIVYYVFIQLSLSVLTGFILLGIALLLCYSFTPVKKKIQQIVAERQEKKKKKFYELMDEYRKDRNL